MEENLGAKKRFLFAAITVVVVILSIELLARMLLATQVGPGILMYGTGFHSGSAPFRREAFPLPDTQNRMQRTTPKHENVKYSDDKNRRYSKYFPNEKKVDTDQAGELFNVTINSDGFRGRDFEPVKEPGVVRVITLGASSTFGYHNRDDQTYPHQLETLLNQKARGRTRYEVINLGIPHLTSDEIYAVFMDEAFPLSPDVVTLYEGFNDSMAEQKASRKPGALQKVVHEICDTFVTAKFLVEVVFDPWDPLISKEEEEEIAKRVQKKYIGNAGKIYEECRKGGIDFIIATQLSKSFIVATENLRGVSYEDEAAMVRSKDKNTRWEVYFLSVMAINDSVRGWATEQSVPLVDVAKLLSAKRDLLLTWVHPGPEGNALIAEALAKPILQYEAQREAAKVH